MPTRALACTAGRSQHVSYLFVDLCIDTYKPLQSCRYIYHIYIYIYRNLIPAGPVQLSINRLFRRRRCFEGFSRRLPLSFGFFVALLRLAQWLSRSTTRSTSATGDSKRNRGQKHMPCTLETHRDLWSLPFQNISNTTGRQPNRPEEHVRKPSLPRLEPSPGPPPGSEPSASPGGGFKG